MKKYIVTINRQFGSLGRPIAAKIAEALGIDYYDRDIVEETAKKMNIQMSTVFEQEEKERSSFFYMQFPLGHGNSELQNKIFETQRQIILNIADKGSCIIVGRCADYILGKMPNHISIYITAPYEQRLKNCVEVLHMSEDEAKKRIREVDLARKNYHKKYAGYLQNDPEHTDIVVNSALLGADETAKILAQVIMNKFYE